MAEINFDATCPQCNKFIKGGLSSNPSHKCPFCNSPLYKSAADNLHSAMDSVKTNNFEGGKMYPQFHLRDVMPLTPSTPKVEIKGISHWLSGDAAFVALKKAVDELVALAPEDNDVLVQAFNISVREIRYIEPHTFLFSGFNDEGHHTSVVVHFSQLVAHIVYLPKKGKERVITGFSRQTDEE